MQIEETDTPSEPEDMADEATPGEEQEPEAADSDEEPDDDAEPDEEDDEEEVDLGDDLKLRVPKTAAQKLKELKESGLRQADYTRKTQDLAERAKAFDAERTQVQTMDAVEQLARGDLANTNAQIAQYEQYDWMGAREQARAVDSDNFDRAQQDVLDAHWQQYQLLKARQQKIGQLLGLRAQDRQSKQQQRKASLDTAVAKLLDEGTPELKKAIPDWSRAKAATLVEDMVKSYGIPRDEFDGIDDPKLYLVMADAVQWRRHQSKQNKAKAIERQQEIEPAAKAGGSKGSVPPGKLSDKLSTEEWIKRRDKQTRQRA